MKIDKRALTETVLKIHAEVRGSGTEALRVLTFTAGGVLASNEVLTHGDDQSVEVHADRIFKSAVIHGAVKVIIGHNHPGATCEPSVADAQVTEYLRAMAPRLGLEFLDHVVFGQDGFYSFAMSRVFPVRWSPN